MKYNPLYFIIHSYKYEYIVSVGEKTWKDFPFPKNINCIYLKGVAKKRTDFNNEFFCIDDHILF